MDECTALEWSIALSQRVIDDAPISHEDMARPTPCGAFAVRELVDHIVDTHHLLAAAAGGDVPAAGDEISDGHRAAGDASVAAWRSRGTEGTIEVGGNELPAAFGLSLHLLEAYLHAWDLAAALGRDFTPDQELTDAVSAAAHVVISDGMRGDDEGMPYGPAVDLDAGSEVDLLVAFAGRDPRRWATVAS
jgi:uncharacterized protein (TIGR03086 family)